MEFKPFRLAGEKDHASKEWIQIYLKNTDIFYDPEIDYPSWSENSSGLRGKKIMLVKSGYIYATRIQTFFMIRKLTIRHGVKTLQACRGKRSC
jgi:hypothetical protein